MKRTLQLEEIAMLLLGVYAFSTLSYPWWVFLALFLSPDIGMIGYLISNKVGALTYNICHHKGIAILIYGLGIYYSNEPLQLSGVIIFAHAAFDRVLGYGLKHEEGFNVTHLGELRKNK